MKTPINSRQRGKKQVRKMFINNILVIILITSGVSISIISVSTYYFGSYVEAPYHNSMNNNSRLVYYGIINCYTNRTDGNTCGYGMGMNISYKNNSPENMSVTIYLFRDLETFSVYSHTKFPFRAGVIKKIKTITLNSKSQFYRIMNATIFPSGNSVNTKFWNMTINSTSIQCVNNVKGLGNPYVHSIHSTQEIIGNYIQYSSGFVLKGLLLLNGVGNEFLKCVNIPPLTNNLNQGQDFNFALAHSNTVPPQNWKGWFTEGIGNAFPVNVALITVGIVVFILRYRR